MQESDLIKIAQLKSFEGKLRDKITYYKNDLHKIDQHKASGYTFSIKSNNNANMTVLDINTEITTSLLKESYEFMIKSLEKDYEKSKIDLDNELSKWKRE